jgi:hypothetical protein
MAPRMVSPMATRAAPLTARVATTLATRIAARVAVRIAVPLAAGGTTPGAVGGIPPGIPPTPGCQPRQGIELPGVREKDPSGFSTSNVDSSESVLSGSMPIPRVCRGHTPARGLTPEPTTLSCRMSRTTEIQSVSVLPESA